MRRYLIVLLASVLLLTACAGPGKTESAVLQTTEPAVAEWGRTVTRNGHAWRYNTRLTTVLFLGVDTTEIKEEHNYIGNGGRSDTMLLLVLNPDTQTTDMILISRDTMATVGVYDRDREKLYDGFMQITMQYAFGDNPKRSCMLSKKAVSQMLLDLPIDYYCSMTLDGISAAVQNLGSLTVTLQDDWTDIDPAYTAGETVTMDGRMVERFLRYRDLEVSGSNSVRMERQAWFIKQMFESLFKSGKVTAEKLLSSVEPYMETDMNADTIQSLTHFRLADKARVLPGGVVEGRKHDEYYIDEEAMKDLLLDVFYYRVS